MDIINRLKQLSLLPGISGQEDAVRQYIIAEISGKCEYYIDPLGSIIAFKKGTNTPKNKLLFSAHMDEIGFIITGITKEGLLRFANVGGIDSRVVFGKEVRVGKSLLPGVIGGAPIHLVEKPDQDRPPKTENMLIDIGATSEEDALNHVHPGDFAVFYSEFIHLGDNTVVGKAFDDRIGCALMLELIDSDLAYDVTFAFTVQEESGCTGGQTASFTVAPDIAVVLEATTASDIAGVEPDSYVCMQGKGPVISFMDRGTVYDQKLYRLTLALAKQNNILAQPKLGVFGGNEAKAIQPSRGGVGVVAVSLPTRYIHSPSNSINISDIESTQRLLKVLIKELAEV